MIDPDLCALIRRMSVENPLWGAPRIHGELLKLGFEVAQSSVAKYMVKPCGPPLQGSCTFLHNHASGPAEILSGSTSQPIRARTGSHARSPKHSLGLRRRAI